MSHENQWAFFILNIVSNNEPWELNYGSYYVHVWNIRNPDTGRPLCIVMEYSTQAASEPSEYTSVYLPGGGGACHMFKAQEYYTDKTRRAGDNVLRITTVALG